MLFYHVVSIMKSPFLSGTCGLCNAQHAVLSADSLPVVQHMLYIEKTPNLGETSACVILHVWWYFLMCHASSQQAAADWRPSSSRCLTYEANDPTKNIKKRQNAEAYLFVRSNSFPEKLLDLLCLLTEAAKPCWLASEDLKPKIFYIIAGHVSSLLASLWLTEFEVSTWMSLQLYIVSQNLVRAHSPQIKDVAKCVCIFKPKSKLLTIIGKAKSKDMAHLTQN